MPYFKAPDNSIHFLSIEDIANGGEKLLPAGCVQITDAEATALLAAQQPAPTVPQIVSPRQIRLAMTQTGIRSNVEAAVNAASQEVQDTYHYATEFRRDDPLIPPLAKQLGITDAQLDQLWSLAATL